MSAAVCAVLAGATLLISPGPFTLAWTHSVQHIRWEEDWQVRDGQLVITAARVRGTGAGMEIPAGAVLHDGAWHYRPGLPAQRSVRLANSAYGGAYEICHGNTCSQLPQADGELALQACED